MDKQEIVERLRNADGRFSATRIALYAAVALVTVLVAQAIWPFQSVPTGSRGVLTQFGAIKSIEPEGLAMFWPWQRLFLFSIRAEEASVDDAEGSTSDTQPVHVALTVRYSIVPDKVAEVFEKYSHDGNLASYVQTATQEVFKAVTAKYTAPELISQRSKVSTDIREALSTKLAIYGAQVINIDMRNFAFSPEYMKAINDKVTQEQLKLAADNRAKTVEAEQKVKIVTAEAEAAAIKAKADGDAYATLTNAKAQAESLRIQNSALSQSREVLELRRIQVEQIKAERWNGQLPQNVYAGTPIPFFDPHAGQPGK